MNRPDLIVHDPKGRIGTYEGMWIDLRDVPGVLPFPLNQQQQGLDSHPTGRFEFRDDGACAEVWEASP